MARDSLTVAFVLLVAVMVMFAGGAGCLSPLSFQLGSPLIAD